MASEPPVLRPATAAEGEAVADVFAGPRATTTYLPYVHTAEEERAFFVGVASR